MQAVQPAPLPIHQNREKEAHTLYAKFQSLSVKGLPTGQLAKLLCAAVDIGSKSQIYEIRACKEATPYKLGNILKVLNMDLPHVVNHVLIKRATYITLIFQQTFKLYLRQKISGCITIYEVQKGSIVPLQVDPDIPEDGSYIIFVSHKRTHTFEKPKDDFYCYRPPLMQSMKLRVAPFHHELQRRDLCGMHAINALVGCYYMSEEIFSNYKVQWEEYSAVPQTGKLEGVDPTFLRSILKKIVSSGTEYEIISIDADTGENRRSLSLRLQPIDRFIVGTAGHCSAFRKDNECVWWRVDSERNEQESYENDSELIDELLENVSASHLYLLLPEDDKEIHFHEQPPTI